MGENECSDMAATLLVSLPAFEYCGISRLMTLILLLGRWNTIFCCCETFLI